MKKSLPTWSSSLEPGNKGLSVLNSYITQPAAQRSILYPYRPSVRRHSGGLYHRVEIYSKKLDRAPISDQNSHLLEAVLSKLNDRSQNRQVS